MGKGRVDPAKTRPDRATAWPRAVRDKAVAIALEQGSSAASQQTDAPARTVRRWVLEEIRQALAAAGHENHSSWDGDILDALRLLWPVLAVRAWQAAAANPADHRATISAATATDKVLLLHGHATQRTARVTEQAAVAEATVLLDELTAKRQTRQKSQRRAAAG